jgi:hypothetical protein
VVANGPVPTKVDADLVPPRNSQRPRRRLLLPIFIRQGWPQARATHRPCPGHGCRRWARSDQGHAGDPGRRHARWHPAAPGTRRTSPQRGRRVRTPLGPPATPVRGHQQPPPQGKHKAGRPNRGEPPTAQPTGPHREDHGGNDVATSQRAADHGELAVQAVLELGPGGRVIVQLLGQLKGYGRTPGPWSASPGPPRPSLPGTPRPPPLAPLSAERLRPATRSCS